MTLGQRLASLRNQKGWSQDELAAALGVSRQSVSKWETDASIPDLDRLVKLSGLYGITLDELVKGEPPAAAPAPTVPARLRRLYRDRAYLLGWLPAAQGAHRICAWIRGISGYYSEMGWDSTLRFAKLQLPYLLLVILLLSTGLWIVFRGRRFSGQFRWRHLGWGAVLAALFGVRRLRPIQTGLLETALNILTLVLYQGADRVLQDLPVYLLEDLPSFLLLIAGLAAVLTGWRNRVPQAVKENSPE